MTNDSRTTSTMPYTSFTSLSRFPPDIRGSEPWSHIKRVFYDLVHYPFSDDREYINWHFLMSGYPEGMGDCGICSSLRRFLWSLKFLTKDLRLTISPSMDDMYILTRDLEFTSSPLMDGVDSGYSIFSYILSRFSKS